jgi:hypothetical protein
LAFKILLRLANLGGLNNAYNPGHGGVQWQSGMGEAELA